MTIYGRGIENTDMDAISNYMDDDIREEIHRLYAPCTHEEFISAYLEEDPGFITTLKREFGFDIDGDPNGYRNRDTGEFWSEEELMDAYAKFPDGYADFEEYLDHMLTMGEIVKV